MFLIFDLLTVTTLNINSSCVSEEELVPNVPARGLTLPVSLLNLTGLETYLLEIIKSIIVIS